MKSPKRSTKEISLDEFPEWLAVKVGAKTRKQFAKETGMTTEMLGKLLSGESPPGRTTQGRLAKIGLRGTRKVFIVDAE